MPVHNTEIANIFNEVADLLDIQGANPFRVRAYRNAARTVQGFSRPIGKMLADDEDLTDIPGIGEDLAAKIEEIVRTGRLSKLQELKEKSNPELIQLLRLQGLGPKRVQTLHQELGITSVVDLENAAKQGKIEHIEGFGAKMQENILEELQRLTPEEEQRILLKTAEELVEPLVEYLEAHKAVHDLEIAGSYRRRKETVGDIDILATGSSGAEISEYFVTYEDVEEVVSQGDTRTSVILRYGLQVDLRVAEQQSYGAAMLYFTGSKAHNIHLRKLAQAQEYKINEYGVFQEKKQIVGKTEEGIYALFDLPWIPPELREDRGEFEAARAGKLPNLITLKDIRGDLQMHTTESDGKASLREMAEAARQIGYDYIAITDHSQRVSVAQGLDAKRLARQCEAIDRLNAELDGIQVLKSIEVDILEDGSLDLDDGALEQLDLTICSIHSYFKLSQKKQTERIIRAMDNPYFTILAHPTGRIIGERAAYQLDMPQIMQAAAERGCFLELNANPERLDLNETYCKMAKESGVKVAISTDAHRPDGLQTMRFGVGQARRGWLESGDVLNTYKLNELQKFMKR